MTFKAYMDVKEPNVCSNALTFDTAEEAEAYARDLFARWFVPVGWYVIESDEIRIPREEALKLAVRSSEPLDPPHGEQQPIVDAQEGTYEPREQDEPDGYDEEFDRWADEERDLGDMSNWR